MQLRLVRGPRGRRLPRRVGSATPPNCPLSNPCPSEWPDNRSIELVSNPETFRSSEKTYRLVHGHDQQESLALRLESNILCSPLQSMPPESLSSVAKLSITAYSHPFAYGIPI